MIALALGNPPAYSREASPVQALSRSGGAIFPQM